MTNWFKTLFTPVPRSPGSRCDPFAVPEIARMSPDELADLPLIAPPAPPARTRTVAARGPLARMDRARSAAT